MADPTTVDREKRRQALVVAQVAKILKTIKSDKEFHKKAIGPDGSMKRDMFMAM
jgi:hypothetical protein